jgi:hypothetical protein
MLLRDLCPSLRLGVIQRQVRHRHARRLDAQQHRVRTDVPTRASFDEGSGRRPVVAGSRGCRRRVGQWRRRRSCEGPVRWKPDEALGFLQLRLVFSTNPHRAKIDCWSFRRAVVAHEVHPRQSCPDCRCTLQTPQLYLRGARPPRKLPFTCGSFKLLHYHWSNVSYMETVLAPRVHALLDLSLQSSDYRLQALQGCGLGGDGPSLGGPASLLNEDEVSSFKRQSPCTPDSMHSTVRVVGARAAVGVLAAARAVAARAAAARAAAARAAVARAIIAAAIAAATGADEARTAEAGHSGGCEAGERRPADAREDGKSMHVRATEAVRVAGVL